MKNFTLKDVAIMALTFLFSIVFILFPLVYASCSNKIEFYAILPDVFFYFLLWSPIYFISFCLLNDHEN
jgi:hypothetical protein